MAPRNLSDIKEEVRARADIVEIIGGYTRLKPAGKNFQGLCPFHADKKPSFNVSPGFQWYKCWSCGEEGDIFTFLQKKENLTFVEALELLAKRVGIPFERSGFSPERISEREEMYALNALAVKYYRDKLSGSGEGIDYLAGRGILKQTQDQFDIGFAPPEWDGLAIYLQRHRANLPLAARIGLVRERKETSGYIDYYRNRVMFPIHDLRGNVAGFGGRAMGDEQPKYINSPQSDVFNKSRLLYGLYFARHKLNADTPPVFVEGYTDVVTTHQAGFTQCVATLGTAMTEEHAQMLVRYNPKVILCYDSDSAGVNATLKGAAIWDGMGVEGASLLVARLPEGDDPDSILKRGDTAAFQLSLDNAVPRVDFEIELVMRRNDSSLPAGRDNALSEVIPILATVKGRTNVDRYVQKLARLHPMYNLNPTRAMESILQDIAEYRASSRRGSTSRARNHTTVEEQNGAPLRENAPPPAFRRRSATPQPFNPGTANWVQSADRRSRSSGWSGQNKNYNGYIGYNGPAGDPNPPSLQLPEHSAAEKAERTLLRALFAGEWRSLILQRTDGAKLITDRGSEIAKWIVKTPPAADGEIQPADVIRLIEREIGQTTVQPDPAVHVTNMLVMEEPEAFRVNHSAIMAEYVRDLVEDSVSVLSNEPLNEATILGCIRRLNEYRNSQAIREINEALQREDLTFQQRREYMVTLMELQRAHRGSAAGS